MSVRGFFAEFFKSPAERHAEAAAMFRARGFTEWQAERAATELWLACRTGSRTPKWITDLLERRAREPEAASPTRRAETSDA